MPEKTSQIPALLPIAIPLTISAAAADRLEILKDAYNAENGTALTLPEWVTLHLRELAIGREWSAAVQLLQAQLEADSRAAIRVEHERLLGLV